MLLQYFYPNGHKKGMVPRFEVRAAVNPVRAVFNTGIEGNKKEVGSVLKGCLSVFGQIITRQNSNMNVRKIAFYFLSQLKTVHSRQPDIDKDEMRRSRVDLL